MNADQRERLRIIIQQAILVRRGGRIDEELAEERSRNMTTIVEIFFADLKEEVTTPGTGDMAEMERDADALLKRAP